MDVLSILIVESVCKVIISIFVFWYFMGIVVGMVEKLNGRKWIYMLIMVLLFYVCIFMLVLECFYVFLGICYVGWILFFGFFVYVIGVCNLICEKYEINGNVVEDFFVVMVLYLFVVY